MKKMLILIAFAYISILSFGQPYPKDKLYMGQIDLWMKVSKVHTGEAIHPYDFIQIEDYSFYANIEKGTFTIYNKTTGDREIYPINEIPKKYFCIKQVSDGAQEYDCPPFLPCIYNGKYGCVNMDGEVVMDFIWSEKDVYIYPFSLGTGQIFSKKTNDVVAVFKVDDNMVKYTYIAKKYEQVFTDLGIEYNRNTVL